MIPLLGCSSLCVTGQTGSGKSQFVFRMLRHLEWMYTEPPEAVLYCYGINQPLFAEMERDIPTLTLHHSLPSSEELDTFTADRRHRLIVIDDLMHQVVSNGDMELLFTQGCHHRRISVIFITQNIFPQGSKSRTIALNTYYLVLMKNVRGASQVTVLERQLYPGQGRRLKNAYADATKEPYRYLVVDTSTHGRDGYRLRTHIFPDEYPIILS